MDTNIAFALAGLGGFNAHGAGFLTAARELQVTPDLITATSGQIVVLAEWIRGSNLETLLVDTGRRPGIIGTLETALTGLPGVFRPATAEYWMRWHTLPKSWTDLAARLVPAQEYVPLRSKAYLQEISDLLSGTSIGTVFNSYNPSTGSGTLFGNDTAKKLLKGTAIEPITPQAVESALWLSLYGFEHVPGDQMDGAYHRPCVIAELHDFKKIFSVRPLARGWHGASPRSWFDVQDWQCEMWFSSGYAAEVADMKRINKLIETGFLNDPRYKKIELVEVCTDHPCGYFNFFTERPQIFRAAYDAAISALSSQHSSHQKR